MIDIERVSQLPFIIFKGQIVREDEPIKKRGNILKLISKKELLLTSLHQCLFRKKKHGRRLKKAKANSVTAND